MKSALTTLLIFFSFLNLLFGQKEDVQLTEKYDYNTLKKKINNCKSDTICLSRNINEYINKAKKDKDTLNQIRGYRYYIQLEGKAQYKDSIFKLLNGSENKQFLSELSVVYFVLGSVFYDKREYSNALTYYLKSKRISDNATDIDFNIALIKSRLGHYEEALDVFINAKNEFKDKGYNTDYIISLYAISDAHRHLKQLDSAILYNNLGLKEAKSHNEQNLIPYFKLNEACINHDNSDYEKSYDSIQKIIPRFIKNNDLSNLAMCYYFKGMSAKELNYTDDYVNSFIKLDSITSLIGDIEPEFRDGYEVLINHFHKKGEVVNELKYVKRLLEIDQVINKRYENLTKRITKEYNTPILLKEKNRLILSLKKEKKSYLIYISLSFLVILLLSVWVIYKRRFYKKRLKLLIDKEVIAQKNNIIKNELKSIDIKEDIVHGVLEKIKDFEKNKGFLNSKIKINSMAEGLNTNANYLSKIINYHKGKSFSNYLNDLRIEYCISRMKSDKIFRKYTIKAISKESGFNSSESFSKAFTKMTGIKPSLFLKELEKRRRNS